MFFELSSSRGFRPLVTVPVVAVWLVLLGILLKDRYVSVHSSVGDTFQLSAAETDDWFLIRIRGSYAGFGRSRQFRASDGWTIRDDLTISLNLQGQVKPIKIANESKVDDQFRLISFRMKVSSGIISFEQKGRMDGRDLVVETPSFQGGGTRRLKLAESPRISRSLGLPLPLTGLKVGDEYRMPIFDPMDGQKWDASVKVLEKADIEAAGKKTEAWRVRAIFRTVEVVLWVDDQGRLLRGMMPLGITVVRSDRDEISREMKTAGELPDFVALTGVPVDGAIPDPARITKLKLKMTLDRAVAIPTDDYRQTYKDSELTMVREALPSATYSLPCKDPKMEEHLAASQFIRSDNSAILEAARKIVGDEKDPVKAARLINHWVYKNLKKVPTPSVPDAYTVLINKQGDCNEHAVLACSLARAVGLPARMVVGIVYNDGGFYYHAWVTYWAGGRWFTGDPLMDQMPADPTHIALLYGDVDKHLNVLSFLGQLKLKVLEAEKR